MGKVWHLSHVSLLHLLIDWLTVRNMRFQALVEVYGALNSVDDCSNNEKDRDDGKGGQRFGSWGIIGHPLPIVNTDELEDEVCQRCEVKRLDLLAVFGMENVKLTIVKAIPAIFSLRVQNPAMSRMTMVTGTAATVSQNSGSLRSTTTTRNCIVKPRKKRKSNLRRAM